MKQHYLRIALIIILVMAVILSVCACNEIVPDTDSSGTDESSGTSSGTVIEPSGTIGGNESPDPVDPSEKEDPSKKEDPSEPIDPSEPVEPDVRHSYTPLSDNYLTFSVGFGKDKAYYYWYAEYAEDRLIVTIDILDDNIYVFNSDIGYNDNIEFTVQENTSVIGLAAGKSLNILVNPVTLLGWAHFATGTSSYGEDAYNNLLGNDLLVSGTERTLAADGYDGYSISVAIDYWLLGNKENLIGNVTIMASARNRGDVSSASYWRSYVGYDCYWGRANTAVRILEDGSFCKNYYDIPDFEQIISEGDFPEGTSLADNMAAVSTTEYVRQYTAGANMFTDRVYLVDEVGIPDALNNKSYIYSSIDAKYTFSVTEAGYVVVAVPATGYGSTISYFENKGFVKIAAEQPRLGYSNSGGTGITEVTDYFVKWCEAGESYTPNKWCLVFFGERAEYAQDYWVANSAKINVIDSADLIARFSDNNRTWQGIPGIEAVPLEGGGTRLWSCCISGSTHEPSIGNYCLYSYSDDGGETWTKAIAVAFDENVKDSRAFDPSLFWDGEYLWLWWNQTNYQSGGKYGGVWCAKVDNAGARSQEGLPEFNISDSKRICNGIKMNKPTVLSTGEWVFFSHCFGRIGYTEMWVSADKGNSWTKRSEMYVGNALFANETAFAEVVRDGETVYMAINRTVNSYCVAVNYSYDCGYTWTDGVEWDIEGPSSRPYLKTLPSGNVIYVHHYYTTERSMMSVWLSEDGGVTWPHCIILDARTGVSYPDVSLDADDNIYVTWDHNRYAEKEILMVKLTEEELLAVNGTIILDRDRIVTVSALGDLTVNYDAETLFIGDSYTDTKYWNDFYAMTESLDSETIGISGSKAELWLGKIWEIVQYNPDNIVIHLGVNDINAGEDPDTCASQIIELLSHIHRDLPDTKIFYISICNNKSYQNMWANYAACNDIVEEFCGNVNNVYFIDFAGALADTQGLNNGGFSSDGLHLNSDGYVVFGHTVLEAVHKANGVQGTISGTIVDEDGYAVEGALVSIGDNSLLTDSDGCYRIDVGYDYDNIISVTKSGYVDYTTSYSLSNLIEENFSVIRNITLILEEIGTVNGYVYDLITGSPVAGATVSLAETDYSATTDQDGRFSITGFVVGDYNLEIQSSGFASYTTALSSQSFVRANRYVYDLSDSKLLYADTADLGTIGGTNAYLTHLYMQRADSGVYVYILPGNDDCVLSDVSVEVWINSYLFVKNSRTEFTQELFFKGDGTIAAYHFPSNKQTKYDSTDGITLTVNDDYLQGYVSYAFIGQHAPSFYTVDKDTTLGISLTTTKLNKSSCDVWKRADMLGISGTAEVVRGNTKDYIFIDKNGVLSETFVETQITLDVLDNVLKSSSEYKEGTSLASDMAIIETPSAGSLKAVENGEYIFSDRTAHAFDTHVCNAFLGMTYLCDSVSASATVTASSAGYVLLYYRSDQTSKVSADWTTLVEKISNPGNDIKTSFTLFVAYLEEGESIEIVADGLLLVGNSLT